MKKDIKPMSLLDKWKSKDKKPSASNTIEKAPPDAKIPLSHGQKRLWFLQQMYPENVFYNLSEYFTFEGNLNVDALKHSLKTFFEKHQVFRSYYEIDENGKPMLKIDDAINFNILEEDFSSHPETEKELKTKQFMDRQAQHSFSLFATPLFKASLLKLTETKHILLLTFHHIISDQWSMNILREELAQYYNRFNKGETVQIEANTIDFSDYALWQNKFQTFDKQLSYWKKKLSDNIPVLDLPTDFKRPITPSYHGTALTLNFDENFSGRILELAKNMGTTPFVLFLSAYYLLLHNFSKQDDIIVGTPVANRDQKQLESIFGLFIDTMVLRTSIKKERTVSQFIEEVKTVFSEGLANKDVPFDMLVKEMQIERSLSVNPLFQTMFVYIPKSELPSFGNDVTLTENKDYITEVSKFDLTLFIHEDHGKIASTFEYATDLFEASTIQRFQDFLQHTLHFIVENLNGRIEDIPALSQTDEKVLHLNNSQKVHPFESYNAIHHIIEDIAKKHPKNTAVSFENQSISYDELNHKSTVLATELLKTNSDENTIVGLCTERSLDMIIGMLAILKAGRAYLPIDPDYPSQRIAFMLKDSKVKQVITQTPLLSLFEQFEGTSLFIDKIDLYKAVEIQTFPKMNGDALAYVIYTSGSTGQPKGVPISHKNIINSTGGRLNFYDYNPEAFLLMSSISFDSSKAGIFWTLCTGGHLVLTKKRMEQDIDKIVKTIERHNVSHTLMLPSLYNVILENADTSKLKTLNSVVVAGEACSISLCENHFKTLPEANLYNEYGPTEASVWCIAHKITSEDLKKEQVPIGEPVANAQIHILDGDLKKVPFGVAGEIYIGGAGLSQGYINRVDLTNKVFIQNPFIPEEKLYKTGDLGKYRNDGTIDFLGRADQQIKIRGFRVELDDIENTINNSGLVKQAEVIVKQETGKPKRLVAFIVPEAGYDENLLKQYLKNALPDYMIPHSFAEIDEIPLLPNGKVDKTKLGALNIVARENPENSTEAPKNNLEQQLLDIWKSIVGIETLGTNDNFFEVGGDSILSIQIIAMARKMGIAIAPNQLFEHQTISELAMFVSREDDKNLNKEDMVMGDIPLSPIQHWFFDTHKLAPEYWNQGFKFQNLPQNVDEERLQVITQKIIKTHDALRLSFYQKREQWQAKVLAPEAVKAFEIIDVSRPSNVNIDIEIEKGLKLIQENIQLSEGGLFKCIFVKHIESSNNSIILLAHHLVIDFVSWQIIINAYSEAFENDNLKWFENKTASIKTWSNHLKEQANSGSFLNELPYWKAQTKTSNIFPNLSENKLPVHQKDVSSIDFNIEEGLTQNLMELANKAFNTKTDELLLTALVDTLARYCKTDSLTLALERHGREATDASMDLSNTVGWFTSFFPKRLDLDVNDDIGSKIMTIKEQMRRIPNGGMGYGILKFLTSHLKSSDYPEIVFNFLGKQNTGETDIKFISKNTIHPLSERYYVLEINALVKGGVLEMEWNYADQIIEKETITSLIANFDKNLKQIIAYCLDSKTRYTPSDFPEIEATQEELDHLMNNQNAKLHNQKIKTIYPLNVMQQGILFHTLTSEYDQGFLNVQCTIDGKLDTEIFKKAWGLTANRHSILRSSVHWDNLRNPLLIVNASTEIKLDSIDYLNIDETIHNDKLAELKNDNRSKGINFNEHPLSKVQLIKTKTDSHILLWCCHHLLLDGWSTSIILKDLFSIYDSVIRNTPPDLPAIPGHASYLNWQKRIPIADAKKFWMRTFEGFNSPFLFNPNQYSIQNLEEQSITLSKEVSKTAHDLAKAYKITLNTLFQGIWSLIISKFSGQDDITFGNTVSGRSGDFPNINLMAGMFTNVLPFRAVMENKSETRQWFQSLQKNQFESRTFEYFSLPEISEWTETDQTSLFDSLFLFENYPWEDLNIGNLSIHSSQSGITSTYPVTMAITTGKKIGIYLMTTPQFVSVDNCEWMLRQFEKIISVLGEDDPIDLGSLLNKIESAPDENESVVLETPQETHSIVSPKNKTELALLKIWEALLAQENIGTAHNFFQIGGTSLMAIKMFTLIEKRLGLRIPPITLLKHPTIASLSDHILRKDESQEWKYVVPIKSGGDKSPLFCIHGGGGFVFFFNPIAHGLEKDRPVYAIQPSGSNNLHQSIEEMARDYAMEIKDIQPKGPYHLLVYCFSPAVGIEIAREFEQSGDTVHLIVIDSIIKQEDFTDPTRIKMRVSGFLSRLASNPLNALKLMISNNYERFLESSVIKLFGSQTKKDLEKIKQNLIRIYKQYNWSNSHKGKTTLILTEKPDKNLNPTYINAWKSITTNDVDVLYTEGQHHQLFEAPYAGKLATQIEKAINDSNA
ncbi:non-ribosomal peptide synthetase [Hyunsoonleella rubra]|uniref:Amino acid adenylation domain-containing protein n=1 Tax=Hyunsoonleella rubra TaxID=1737062 RepID=A0ABW5TB85_9FLAO